MVMNYPMLQALVLVMTTVVFTASLKCDKLIMIAEDGSRTRVTNDVVLEMGRYRVRTTQKTSSDPVKDLVSRLRGASDIKYRGKTLTAVLQPRDLKKVTVNDKQISISKGVCTSVICYKHFLFCMYIAMP